MAPVGHRPDEQGNADLDHRQHADCDRRRRRGQVAPLLVLVDVIDWRRRRRRPEIGEGIDRLLLVEDLVRRRGRQILVRHWRKIRRRLKRHGKDREASARVGDMRTPRVYSQVSLAKHI
jgi:hypothetical protein